MTFDSEVRIMTKLLEGKNAFVAGILNEHSIAWAVVQALQNHGANVVGSAQTDKIRKKLASLEGCPAMVTMDVSKDSNIKKAIEETSDIFEGEPIHCLVHSIAGGADREDLRGRFLDAESREGGDMYKICAESLKVMARYAEPYMARYGSVFYMTFFASEKTFPNYNTMGPVKALLESIGKHMVPDLADSKQIRVIGISAGPIRTTAARMVGQCDRVKDLYHLRSPLGNITAEDVGNAVVILASDLARMITGDIIHVDGGFHTAAISRKEAELIDRSLKE